MARPLNEKEVILWKKYLESLPEAERPLNPQVEAAFAGNREITDSLIALYLEGKKWAGSGLVEDYESVGDPLPKVGNYWLLLNSKDEAACLLRTERIEFHKYKDIPVEIAVAEGEGDLTVESWKELHGKFFVPHLEKWGVKNLDDATVITEFFKIVAIF